MADSKPPRDLPQVSDSVDPEIRRPLARVIEEVQRLLEFRGDPLDAALTLRKAIARGLVDSVGRSLTGTVTYVNTFPSTGGSGGGGGPPDLTPPPDVTGLSVVAGFTQILVEFDAPVYTQGHGNLQTNIYASKKATTDATMPVFGDAVLVFSAPGALNVVSIPSELNTRWHVWAKYKTVDGVESVMAAGGANGYNVAGVFPATGQDTAQLLDLLAGAITSSELDISLRTPIELVTAADTVPGSVNARVKAERDARVNAVSDAISTAATYTGSYAYPKADGEQVALDLLALDAIVVDPTTGLVATRAKLISDYATIAGPTNSLASVTTALEAYADFAAEDARVSARNYTESYAYSATNGNALAGDVSTLIAKVDSPSITPGPNYNLTFAALQTERSVRAALDGAVNALWTIRAQVSSGGATMAGGIGLSATATASGGATIDFGVIANRFYVGAPNDGSAPGIPDAMPFIIQATPTTINGVAVPAGTYIRDAFILNGSITNAKIGNAAIDDAKVANLSAAKLTVGDGTVGGDLKSTSWTAGSGVSPGTGWKLTPGGTLYASGAVIYGTIYASAGVFAGSLSAATGTFAGALSAATGTFAGDISAASGTFAGSLNVKSAASGARMEITNASIKVFDGVATLPRVQIGDLSA
jgi:hypothetical protein